MADKYVRKEDAVNVVANTAKIVASFNYQYAIDALLALTPADVAPVVHAYWRDTGSGQECSACKEIQYGYDTGRHYCPNCGAKMDKE